MHVKKAKPYPIAKKHSCKEIAILWMDPVLNAPDCGLFLSSTELVDLVSELDRIQLSNITRLPWKTNHAPCDKHICLAFDLAIALAILTTYVQLIPSRQSGQNLAPGILQHILFWIHDSTFSGESLPISSASLIHGSTWK